MSVNNGLDRCCRAAAQHDWQVSCPQVRALSNSFAEKDGAPLSWRTDQRYSGLNIGVLGIFYRAPAEVVPASTDTQTHPCSALCVPACITLPRLGVASPVLVPLTVACGQHVV